MGSMETTRLMVRYSDHKFLHEIGFRCVEDHTTSEVLFSQDKIL